MYSWKNFCIYFTYLPRSPHCADLYEILHEGSTGSSSRRNQLCWILSQSDRGFWFFEGSNFWLSHRKEKLPLTHGLSYCSACDDYRVWQKSSPLKFFAVFSATAWSFNLKFYIFICWNLLHLTAKQNLILLKNNKVIDFLTWPPTDFFTFKNVLASTPI